MSRTYRRKNIDQTRNKSSHRAGRKTAGVLTAWYLIEPSTNGHNGVKIYQKMIDEDLRWRKVNLFGESKHHNAWGPSREYRNLAERQNRYSNNRELRRVLNNQEYDGQFMAKYHAGWDSYYW